MAQIEVIDVIAPAVVGAASGAGEIVQLNRLERKTSQGLPDNILMDNAALITDVVVGGGAIANMLLPNPIFKKGAEEALGAGVSVLVRRGVDVLGRNLLGLQRVVTRNPARGRREVTHPNANGYLAAYSPAAAIEAPVMANKRQFFSVT